MSIEIKTVNLDKDFLACLEIRKKVFVQEQKVPIQEELDGLDKKAIHFLALLNDQPVGTARVRIDSYYYKIERVALLKEARGKNIGRHLMHAIQQKGDKEYPKYLQMLSSQKNVIPFYEKLGWIPIGDFYLDANISHRSMIRIAKNSNHLNCLQDPNCSRQIKDILFNSKR